MVEIKNNNKTCKKILRDYLIGLGLGLGADTLTSPNPSVSLEMLLTSTAFPIGVSLASKFIADNTWKEAGRIGISMYSGLVTGHVLHHLYKIYS